MFSYLNEHPQVDIYYEADLFPADSTKYVEMTWAYIV